MKKKPIFAKARPKRLGKPKSFNKMIRSLVKRFLFIKTSLSHNLLRSISRERKSNG